MMTFDQLLSDKIPNQLEAAKILGWDDSTVSLKRHEKRRMSIADADHIRDSFNEKIPDCHIDWKPVDGRALFFNVRAAIRKPVRS